MKRRTWIISTVVAVLAVIIGGGWWFFVRDNSPEQVSLSAALDKAAAATSSTAAGSSNTAAAQTSASTGAPGSTGATATTGASPSSGLEGNWKLRDGMENFVGFRIQEELAGFGSKNVVGRTPGVTGSMVLTGTTISGVKIEADMTQISTDSAQRNRAIKTRGLETNSFPTATFTQTAPVTLSGLPKDGVELTATIKGDLLVHGVTKAMDIPVKAQLQGDTVVVVVEPVQVAIADFQIEKPLVPGQVLSIDDNAQFELQLFFIRSQA